MITTYIALGSNLDNPKHQVELGIESLKALPKSAFIKQSSLYLTAPVGNSFQPDFVNAVVEMETTLQPMELLNALLNIERQHGRVRDCTRWGPRVLDLDILLYGDQHIQLPVLTIPHPRLPERAFALVPLLEIAPDATLPDSKPLMKLLKKISTKEIILLS